MSSSGGPRLVKGGMVFGYDTGYGVVDSNRSSKYYKGQPGTNLWDSIDNTSSLRSPRTAHFWDGTKWLRTEGYTHPGIPGPKGIYLGKVFKFTSGALSSTWSGNSYGYMLRDIPCTNNATVVMSCWAYVSKNCNITGLPAVIEGELSGEAAVPGYNSEYNLSSKGTWQRLAKKAISDGNVRFIPTYGSRGGVTDGSFSGFFIWGAPQVLESSVPTPFIATGSTRSTTNTLIDLKKTTSISVANVSFNSSGLPIFDGTDDFITGTNTQYSTSQSWTADLIVKNLNSADTSFNPLFGGNLTAGGYWMLHNGGQLTYYEGVYGTTTKILYTGIINSNFPQNKFIHLTIRYNGNSTFDVFLNNTKTNFSYTFGGSFSMRLNRIGAADSRYGNFEIPVFKFYDKALSDQEIRDTYRTYKKRFRL